MASAGRPRRCLGVRRRSLRRATRTWHRRYILLLLLIATLQTTMEHPGDPAAGIGPRVSHVGRGRGHAQRRGVRVHLRARHHPPRAHSGYVRSEEPPGGESHRVVHPHVPQRALPEHLPGQGPGDHGLGEAVHPAAQSLIAIMYGPGERASAGHPAARPRRRHVRREPAGACSSIASWRGVFADGHPRYVLAALLLLTLKTPRGGHREVHCRNRLSRGTRRPAPSGEARSPRSETDDFGQTVGGIKECASPARARSCISRSG